MYRTRRKWSRRRKYRNHSLRDGLRNCGGNSCTVRRKVKPEPISSVSNSRRIAPKTFSCLRNHGCPGACVLCDVLYAQRRPKGHRQNQPAQPRPRTRRREYGYNPLGDATPQCRYAREIRTTTPGTSARRTFAILPENSGCWRRQAPLSGMPRSHHLQPLALNQKDWHFEQNSVSSGAATNHDAHSSSEGPQLTKASLVFVSSGAGPRVTAPDFEQRATCGARTESRNLLRCRPGLWLKSPDLRNPGEFGCQDARSWLPYSSL